MVQVNWSRFWLNAALLTAVLLILSYVKELLSSDYEGFQNFRRDILLNSRNRACDIPKNFQGGGGCGSRSPCGSTSHCTPAYGMTENSFWKPYSWLNNIFYYFPFPSYRPYWYRNYGEVVDPYYPRYYQTYHDDSENIETATTPATAPAPRGEEFPYFYYNDKSFDRYRKVWGSRPGRRCRRHLKKVPAATKSYRACRPKHNPLVRL